MNSKTDLFKLSWQSDIAIIAMDDTTQSVNCISAKAVAELNQILDSILINPSQRTTGIIFTSAKKQGFLAGADIKIFDQLTTAQAGAEASIQLQKLFERFESAPFPTVAAIHGICLGGGLELSLACHMRVCTTDSSTQLGLPEVQLGLLPGGGGSQRLPRLVGIVNALDLILTGKKINSKKALSMGLVDAAVPASQLIETAMQLCQNKQPLRPKRSLLQRIIESNAFGRSFIETKTTEKIAQNTKGKYPAPYKCAEAVFRGMEMSLQKGLELEAKLFGELVVTKESRSLVHIFNLMTQAKKNTYPNEIKEKSKTKFLTPLTQGNKEVAILGAGLMGAGVATVLAENNVRCGLLDRNSEGVARGLNQISQYFEERLRKKRIKSHEKQAILGKIHPTIKMDSLKNSQFFIEAVFEDLTVKQDMLKKCENIMGKNEFIFATNTSSIPISNIAKTAQNPQNVVGMHFFSPVPKMPLVEIIAHPDISPEAVSATVDIALAMGKYVITVQDGPGFYTTRILAFLIAEALNMLDEGVSIEQIDKAMEKFGFPVGPVTLLDEVGIDVGGHIVKTLQEHFSDRLKIPPQITAILAENRKGRKNGRGFYSYENGKRKNVDDSIYKHFKGNNFTSIQDSEIQNRCALVFINEAARCLDERIIQTEGDGDFGAIFGLGFPPFLGGPFHYAKDMGTTSLKNTLEKLYAQHGERFKPAKYWNK